LNSNELDNVNLDQEDNPAGVSAVTKNAGDEHSIFMIPAAELVATIDGGGGTVMLIQPTSVLPDIQDAFTAIDGLTQSAYTGQTNGSTRIDEVTTGPEVIIDYQGNFSTPGTDDILSILADNVIIDSVGLTGTTGNQNHPVDIEVNVNNVIVRNTTIWSTGNSSLKLQDGASNNQILDNVLRLCGTDSASSTSDGIAFGGNNNGNTISGNHIINSAGFGIDIVPTNPNNNNVITGNLIKGSGASTAAQDAGIALRSGSSNTISNNTITGNAGEGILIIAGNTGNAITQNMVHDNSGLGIDLRADSASTEIGDGVTANDALDPDTGGNNLQNYPVLSSADSSGGNTTVIGTFNSTASTTFTIEFFSSTVPDPSGNGEGEVYLGSDTVTTDGSGDANINTVLGVAVAAGDVITATATDPSNNTSEFSVAVIVTTGGLLSHWPLDEAAGLTADEIILDNDGTYQNGVTLNQPGACPTTATAVSFNRSLSQYVEIPHSDAYLLDEGTVTFWAQATGTANNQGLFSKDSTDNDTGGHLTIRIQSGGTIEVRLQDNTTNSYYATSSSTITPGAWFHVAFSWGSAGMQLYIDGNAPDTNPYTGGLGTTSGGAGNFEPIALGLQPGLESGRDTGTRQLYGCDSW
jgi:parallel beta-helix repeat protein